MQNAVIKIAGMDNEGCADTLDQLLGSIDGISDVRVSLRDGQATLRIDEHRVSPQALVEALEAAGYASYADDEAPAKTPCANCCGGGCGG